MAEKPITEEQNKAHRAEHKALLEILPAWKYVKAHAEERQEFHADSMAVPGTDPLKRAEHVWAYREFKDLPKWLNNRLKTLEEKIRTFDKQPP